MIKTAIKKMESVIDKKHPEFRGKFYVNRKNKIIHLGMDKSIFDFSNFRLYLWDCEWTLKKELPNSIEIEFFKIPTLVSCTKWKFDYIIARQSFNYAC